MTTNDPPSPAEAAEVWRETMAEARRPNALFMFAVQVRAQAAGYAGDPNVLTPALDPLHGESIFSTTAVSTTPVCCPTRSSLLTGQFPLMHGAFMNDVPRGNRAVSIARAFAAPGHDTGYIGTWHVDGPGAPAPAPGHGPSWTGRRPAPRSTGSAPRWAQRSAGAFLPEAEHVAGGVTEGH